MLQFLKTYEEFLMEEETKMQKVKQHLKRNWKRYAAAAVGTAAALGAAHQVLKHVPVYNRHMYNKNLRRSTDELIHGDYDDALQHAASATKYIERIKKK